MKIVRQDSPEPLGDGEDCETGFTRAIGGWGQRVETEAGGA